jgi:spore coat protein U-like protein
VRRLALRVALLLAALLALAAPAVAQCTISATPLSFGNYDVFSATPLDSTSTVTVQCNYIFRNVTVTLTTGWSGNFAARLMRAGGDTLTYNIYRAADHTTVWGDGITGGTGSYSGYVWLWGSVTLTLYGRIPAAQDARAGTYTDTIQAIVNY